MDIMLSCPLEDILSRLPVAEDVHEALVKHRGPLRGVYLTVSAFEQNRVAEALQFAQQHGIETQRLCDAYTTAIRWADEVFGV